MLVDLLKHAISIEGVVEGSADAHGNTATTWLERAATVGFFQPVSETELREAQQTVLGDWRVFLFPDEVIYETDRIVWETRKFQVVSILEHHRPSGAHHKTVLVQEVKGGPS